MEQIDDRMRPLFRTTTSPAERIGLVASAFGKYLQPFSAFNTVKTVYIQVFLGTPDSMIKIMGYVVFVVRHRF